MQHFLSLLKRNTKIFFIAIVCSFALLYVIKNPSLFQASVLNLWEIETIKKNQRDLAYKTTGNVLDIFVDESLKNLSELTLSIAYDPLLNVAESWWTAQSAYEIISSIPGSLNVKLNQFSPIDTKQSLLIIPFSWTNMNILVQEAHAVLTDGTSKDLAIGNLSQQLVHGQ